MIVKELIARFIMYSVGNFDMYYAHSMGAIIVGMGAFATGTFTLDAIFLILGFTLMVTSVVLLACGEMFRRLGEHMYKEYRDQMEEKEDER